MEKIRQFLREAYNEMKKVSWPTREQTIQYTMLVVAISISVAVFLGILDYMFGSVIKSMIL
ncbi:MAG: preprotein translocase subunit SecE [Candidatus Moraniibacteriota bacterium]|nr:MAG: preprotein translocase subunit SecE [Candidatus Moranbacteria bacterium]